jgi:transposase
LLGPPAAQLGRELLDYIGIMFDCWDKLRAGELSREQFRELMAPVRLHVEALLARSVAAKVAARLRLLRRHPRAPPGVVAFVDTEDVDPTNNHGERELRAFVLCRKRSFGTQSERGNLFAERPMTVAHTARKQKKNVLEFLTACCVAARGGTTSPALFAPT